MLKKQLLFLGELGSKEFPLLHCGFCYTLPERDGVGTNALLIKGCIHILDQLRFFL
jgi:hypothetical protein